MPFHMQRHTKGEKLKTEQYSVNLKKKSLFIFLIKQCEFLCYKLVKPRGLHCKQERKCLPRVAPFPCKSAYYLTQTWSNFKKLKP